MPDEYVLFSNKNSNMFWKLKLKKKKPKTCKEKSDLFLKSVNKKKRFIKKIRCVLWKGKGMRFFLKRIISILCKVKRMRFC